MILHRKNAYFYKTENGARVGDLFMSLIHTCELNTVNPYDYLTELNKHASELSVHPADWMPWTYRDTLASQAGLLMMKALIDEEVEQIAGPRYGHQSDRQAMRWGQGWGAGQGGCAVPGADSSEPDIEMPLTGVLRAFGALGVAYAARSPLARQLHVTSVWASQEGHRSACDPCRSLCVAMLTARGARRICSTGGSWTKRGRLRNK